MQLVQKTTMKPEWTSCKSQAGGTDCRGPSQSILLGQTWTLNDSITIGPFSQQHRPPYLFIFLSLTSQKEGGASILLRFPFSHTRWAPSKSFKRGFVTFFRICILVYICISIIKDYTTPSTTTHNESVRPGTIVVKKDARSCQLWSLRRSPVVCSFLFVFALGHMSVFVNMHLGRRQGMGLQILIELFVLLNLYIWVVYL